MLQSQDALKHECREGIFLLNLDILESEPLVNFVPPADTAALFCLSFTNARVVSIYNHSFSLRPHGSYIS